MKNRPEIPALAAAWQRNADPLAGATYLAATRQGGGTWRATLAEIPAPVRSLADIYGAKP